MCVYVHVCVYVPMRVHVCVCCWQQTQYEDSFCLRIILIVRGLKLSISSFNLFFYLSIYFFTNPGIVFQFLHFTAEDIGPMK